MALPRYSGATAKVAMSQVEARSRWSPVRLAIVSTVSPHTASASSRVLNPAGDGSRIRMVPAATWRRWSMTQRNTLASSYGAYSLARSSGVLPNVSMNTTLSRWRASSERGSVLRKR